MDASGAVRKQKSRIGFYLCLYLGLLKWFKCGLQLWSGATCVDKSAVNFSHDFAALHSNPPILIFRSNVSIFFFSVKTSDFVTIKWKWRKSLPCFFEAMTSNLCASSPDAPWVNTGTTTASTVASWCPCRWTRRSSSPVWWGASAWSAASSASWFSSTRSASAAGRPSPWCKCQCCRLFSLFPSLPPPPSWLVTCCDALPVGTPSPPTPLRTLCGWTRCLRTTTGS